MKIFYSLFFLSLTLISNSQTNLLLNGEFDDFTNPDKEGQANRIDNWESRVQVVNSQCNGQEYFLHSPDLIVSTQNTYTGSKTSPYSGTGCVGMGNYELLQQNFGGISNNQPYNFSIYLKAHEGISFPYENVKFKVYLAKSKMKYKSESNENDLCSEDYTSYQNGSKILIGEIDINKIDFSSDDWRRISMGFYLSTTEYPDLSDYNWLVMDLHNDDYSAPNSSDCFNFNCFDGYIWLDNARLERAEFCSSVCSPNLGNISLNSVLPNAMAANGQGLITYFDNGPQTVYVTPFNFIVENAMGVDFSLFNRWGELIHHETAFDPNGLKDFGFDDYQFFWDGENSDGNLFPEDIYLYNLKLWRCGEIKTYIGKSLYYIPLNTHTYNVPNFHNYDLADCCPEYKYHQNEIFNGTSVTRVDDFISAGYNVTIAVPNGNVIVSSGSNVKFFAENNINLEPGFSVESGGNFDAILTNCIYGEKKLTPERIRYFPKESSEEVLTNHESITIGELSLFPNPINKGTNNGEISIVGLKVNEIVKARIYDEMGKSVLNIDVNGLENAKLDVSTLSSGLYFVQLINVNNSEVFKLIIK